MLQCPDAVHVAGYSTWKKLGYQVKKGAKGIAILAPRPFGKMTSVNEQTGEEKTSYTQVCFTTAYVFDASQLVEDPDKPLPTFFTPLEGNPEALYERLTEVIQKDGIVIEEAEIQAEGVSTGGKILIKKGQNLTNKLHTLIHEYSHELLHQKPEAKELTKRQKECQAESIAYTVAYHFGLHNPFSSDYLQMYGNSEKELTAAIEIVRETAASIIEKLESSSTDFYTLDQVAC